MAAYYPHRTAGHTMPPASPSSTPRLTIAVALAMVGFVGYQLWRRSRPSVVVYTSLDQRLAEPVLLAFARESGVQVRPVYDSDSTAAAGAMSRLMIEAVNPDADVFWSGEPARPEIIVERGDALDGVAPAACGLRSRVILVHKGKLGDRAAPASILQIADPAWRNEVALSDDASSTASAHAAALASVLGDERVRELYASAKRNGLRIVTGDGAVKDLVVRGEVTWGVVDTDDAAEALRDAPGAVAVVHPDQQENGAGAYVFPTSAVALRVARNPKEAKALIQFLATPHAAEVLESSGMFLSRNRDGAGAPREAPARALTAEPHAVAAALGRLGPWWSEWSRR